MALGLVTAGESHGQTLAAIVTGLPAGLRLDELRSTATCDAASRDTVAALGRSSSPTSSKCCPASRHGVTLGTPLTLVVRNRDHANWTWG